LTQFTSIIYRYDIN